MSTTPTQEQIDAFVAACHGDLSAVQSMLADNPEMVNSRSSLDESPLQAAAHVGAREIATYLLSQGADMDICAAASLGDVATVREYLEEDRSRATATGAHDIPVLFHAVAGGNVEVAQTLIEHGADLVTVTSPESTALNMAAARDHVAMARWLLDHGAPTDVADYQGKTPLDRAVEEGNEEIAQMIREIQRKPGP
ncbi:MAG: ankyrin repeat domain-containing protein [Thermomicrobiales bacterium]